jgi:hypothetical protein
MQISRAANTSNEEWMRITGYHLYRATYCARTDPLPLLPSGPGGVGGVASRRTRHSLIIAPGSGQDRPL